mmetsp:Transcript_27085/g.63409  ORF Transcript_27085/g.63409 Transcript_27085/m.63409 type:complete len:94 (+) Transcript_27085:2-283(+)
MTDGKIHVSYCTMYDLFTENAFVNHHNRAKNHQKNEPSAIESLGIVVPNLIRNRSHQRHRRLFEPTIQPHTTNSKSIASIFYQQQQEPKQEEQ